MLYTLHSKTLILDDSAKSGGGILVMTWKLSGNNKSCGPVMPKLVGARETIGKTKLIAV